MEDNEKKIYKMLGNIYHEQAVSNIMYSNGGLREALITLSDTFDFENSDTGLIYLDGNKKMEFDIDFEQILIFKDTDLFILNFDKNENSTYGKDMKLNIIKNYTIDKMEIHNNGVYAFDPIELKLIISDREFTFVKNKQLYTGSLTEFIKQLNK